MRGVYLGDSLIRQATGDSHGELVSLGGRTFYKITNYHQIPAFFMTLVSSSDHWMFLSSSGGLTCGRGNPDNALFPYYTDDKIHDAHYTTGPQTSLLIEKSGRIQLWRPFTPEANVYEIERNLYKNLAGNSLIFEEINFSLGLTFSYRWSSSDRFGFVRKSTILNQGDTGVTVDVLDGLRNLLPYGVTRSLQANMSTLVDAYKQAEKVPDLDVGIYTLSSILTDRAEPCEALRATVAWSIGLDRPQLLLSGQQVDSFGIGAAFNEEPFTKGRRGAFHVRSSFPLAPGSEKNWYLLADVDQGPSDLSALLHVIREGVTPDLVETDVRSGTLRLFQLAGEADGCQLSSDVLVAARHFSNTVFNIMRGGTFLDAYSLPVVDLLKFAETWNQPLRARLELALGPGSHPLAPRNAVLEATQNSGDADLERIALEYLPLTFSRRHGDPSRPWNHFNIDLKNPDGSDKLYFEGNWRDIFQNWEALAISYPEYIESFIAKFVNASTLDGYNPYRITRGGFDWEVLEAGDPWSNIGYWGDHQVNYLLRLLEFSCKYHPGRIGDYLTREIFVYADVPYRIRSYDALKRDPRNSVDFDSDRADAIAVRVSATGCDGKLVHLQDGTILRVSLLEKLLVPVLAKVLNFVPGGGIWMNTQRPEWNDANNALVGFGLSMVTLCYLRRFLLVFNSLLLESPVAAFAVSREVADYFRAVFRELKDSKPELESLLHPSNRKTFMDGMGELGDVYRDAAYSGFCGEKDFVEKSELLEFVHQVFAYLDHSLARNRRVDGLYHSYNLVRFDEDGYHVENLFEMLEGQVAVLSSAYLDPRESLALLDALRASKIYRPDQNSYMLYPCKKQSHFLDRNVLDSEVVKTNAWIRAELESGRMDYLEQDIDGRVHFNSRFRNAAQLRAAMDNDPSTHAEDAAMLCSIYEQLFRHRQFTGRSGTMYKYEGQGCIYWHMVSKLLLATSEVIELAAQGPAGSALLDPLIARFEEIQEGLGVHKSPGEYGAFPMDAYSHTPGFAGVQQPGMTGQVKEDIIARFSVLGVRVDHGAVTFEPVILRRNEFIPKNETWRFFAGREERQLELEEGSLAFTLCGVPVVYRLSSDAQITVFADDSRPEVIHGSKLSPAWSHSLFNRENRISKIIVDVKRASLR